MIQNYFKIAWRNLWRHKRMTFINVAGLGIGMAATVLIALWVQNELSFDKFQPDVSNIYRIKSKIAISKTETWLWETSQYALGELAVKQIPEIEDLTRLDVHAFGDLNLHNGDKVIAEKKAAYVDGRWFNMFHYDFVDGSPEAFVKNPFSLIITASAAKKYFGIQEPVGKLLRIDTANYEVQAVIKDNPTNSSFQFNLLIPVATQLISKEDKENNYDWGNYNYQTFVRLKPNANPKAVAVKLALILSKNSKEKRGADPYSLIGLSNIHFENDVLTSHLIHGNHTIVNVFVILAILLLVTACINYVNLTTARASLRSKEVSVRKIVGAGRIHLFGQFMSESFLVSLCSLVFAILLAQISIEWFRSLTGKEFENPVTSSTAWVIMGVTLFISFLLNGIYPAVLLSAFKPISVFRGKAILNFKDVGLRRLLVVVQYTISVILIIGTIVIYKQLQFIQKMDPGYDRAQVFEFSFPYWRIKGVNYKNSDVILNRVKQQLKEQSAIAYVSVGGTGLVDFEGQSSGGFDWNGRPKDFKPALAPLRVDADFQKLMHIKLIDGRWFNEDAADKKNVILNETAIKLLQIQKPYIGQRFIHHKDTGVVIGIAKDFHYRSLHDKIGPMLITEGSGNGFYIKTAPGNTKTAITAAGKIWKETFPDDPFTYDFLDDSYNNLYKTEQQSSTLITVFACIAIFVSALGLLGLAAFAAEQKVKEIGIRKVLGASVQQIVSLLSADFVKMVLIACFIAFPIGWWAMNKWLQDFAYRINLSWWIFLCAACIALIIALVTVSYQAFKAAVANPVNSLRSE